MARMLARSKSLRFLKSNRKEQEYEATMPPPMAPQTDFDEYALASPISKAENRLETPELVTRPSTSGGPGDRTTMFHMKKTNAAPSVYSQDRGFAFPSSNKSATALDTTEGTEEQGIIGIALGSPTVGSHWNSTPQASTLHLDSQAEDFQMVPIIHPNGSSPYVAPRQEQPKSKLSRWKSLFKKASPPPPPPQEKPSFYQLTQTVTAGPRADSHHDDESLNSQSSSKHERETMRTLSPGTYKPDIRASRKAGAEDFIAPQSPPEPQLNRGRAATLGVAAFNPRSTVTIQRSSTTPNPPPRSLPDQAFGIPQVVISKSQGDGSSQASAGGLLDVSIPDVTMERYSVMFGNLLQSNSNRSSSLLARRQANAEKLKPLNQLSVRDDKQDGATGHKIQRRATSPTMPSPSPRLSLFPSTNPGRAPSPRSTSANRAAKALQRSQTAPSKSPLRQTFSQTPEKKAKKAESTALKPAASPHLKPAVTPTSIHSFESDADSITIVVAQTAPGYAPPFKMHLDEKEPEWEICSKPKPLAIVNRDTSATVESAPATTTKLARTDSQRQPRVTKLSALSSHPSSAPLDAPSPLQRLQSLTSPPLSASQMGEKQRGSEQRSASQTRVVESKASEAAPKAMVGVARSISVSRANSPRALVRTMTDTASVKSPQGERLVERQVLTPTMVEVRNRKSQRVQLVDA